MSFLALDAKQFATWNKKLAAKQAWDAEQASASKLASKPTADDDWSDVVSGKPEPDPSGYLFERAAERLDIEWAHFGLSYLLQRAADMPYALADLVPDVFGAGLGQQKNEPVVLDGAKVESGYQFLLHLRESELRAAWRPDEMSQLGIFPATAWGEAETLETLIATFRDLVGLFERAHRKQRVLVAAITI
jgi:hypothetical protein